ncbi:MAG TPA: SprT family zinc-dependent metalloprotease [Alphaproteobacteria bacterium]|nr:SprT family zinc-dependent metalloprotease [Alphaproteobacteria bacterium]
MMKLPFLARTTQTPERRPLAVAGVDAPVEVRISPRARRLSLRVDPADGTVRVVVPKGVPPAVIADFVARHGDWLRARLEAVPPPLPFVDGAAVPYLGIDHVIRHQPLGPRTVRREDGTFVIGGGAEHMARRLTDWLKEEARRELGLRSRAHAARLPARVASVTVRDTRSRWGSCSASGRLNFSWRLVLAPETVLDYVVAHEVAHLKEMNHGPRFWALVDRLHPDVAGCRAWLKRHGGRLHRYG